LFGNITVNVVPIFSTDVTVIVPFKFVTASFTMYNPRPDALLLLLVTKQKFCLGIWLPIPLSLNSILMQFFYRDMF
jgi:hypothetical protein